MAEFPPSTILRDLLLEHVATSLWELNIAAMPDQEDRAIMVMDTVSGVDPNPKFTLDFPTCQVTIRGNSSGYLDTYREAKAVKDLLLGVDSYTTTEGDRMVSITQNGDLGFIGRDDNMRPMFVINFALIIEPQVVANSNRIAL